MANKTYLDLYRAISKGVELPDDIPIALKISPSAAKKATDRLREALILQKTKRLYGRGRIVIELDPEARFAPRNNMSMDQRDWRIPIGLAMCFSMLS